MKYIRSSENKYAYDILSIIAGTGNWGAISYLNDNGDFVEDDFSDSMIYSWEKFLNRIRFINPENNFDYSKYGDFFFFDNSLYVLTDKDCYVDFDIKNDFINTAYGYLLESKKYLIKGTFAGFYIGRRDDYGERIYYGDILKLELNNFSKCKSCQYFGGPFKDREVKDIDVVYGPISFNKSWRHCSNPQEPFYIADQAFGIVPNLCMSINTKIVANIFYDENFNSNNNFNLSTIYKDSLPDSSEYTCGFWEYFVPKDIRESNSTNENWEYAVNEYRKKRELIMQNANSFSKANKSNSELMTKSNAKKSLWYMLKNLWS